MANKSRFVRRYAHFTDQHGRKWGALVEGETGAPCSPMDLLHRTPAGNVPPWLPSGKYLDFDPLEQGRFTINYAHAIADAVQGQADWLRIVRQYAMGMYADKAAEQIETPGPGLLAIVGPKPQGPELIEACEQGNKWALGFSDAVPDWAKPILAVQMADPSRRPARSYPDAEEKPRKGVA